MGEESGICLFSEHLFLCFEQCIHHHGFLQDHIFLFEFLFLSQVSRTVLLALHFICFVTSLGFLSLLDVFFLFCVFEYINEWLGGGSDCRIPERVLPPRSRLLSSCACLPLCTCTISVDF